MNDTWILPGMDHIHAMLEGNPDNIILRQICSDGREALANLVRFIGLEREGV